MAPFEHLVRFRNGNGNLYYGEAPLGLDMIGANIKVYSGNPVEGRGNFIFKKDRNSNGTFELIRVYTDNIRHRFELSASCQGRRSA